MPLPLPEGSTVHHEALLLADQDELEVTVKVVEPAVAETLLLDGATERVGAAVALNVPAISGACGVQT